MTCTTFAKLAKLFVIQTVLSEIDTYINIGLHIHTSTFVLKLDR